MALKFSWTQGFYGALWVLGTTQAYPTKFFGSTTLRHQSIEEVNASGRLEAHPLNVKGDLNVSGTFAGKHITCAGLRCSGACEVSHLQATSIEASGRFVAHHLEVKEKSHFKGALDITRGELTDIEIDAPLATLTDCRVKGNILMQANSSTSHMFGSTSSPKTPRLILRGTVISGDVVFKDKGEIEMDETSKVTGKILSGKILGPSHEKSTSDRTTSGASTSYSRLFNRVSRFFSGLFS